MNTWQTRWAKDDGSGAVLCYLRGARDRSGTADQEPGSALETLPPSKEPKLLNLVLLTSWSAITGERIMIDDSVVSLERLLISSFETSRETHDRPIDRPSFYHRLLRSRHNAFDTRDINLSRANRWNSLETLDSARLGSTRFGSLAARREKNALAKKHSLFVMKMAP